MYLDQWITILKVWFLLQFLSDQNFPNKTEEDFQRFQSDGDFFDSTSELMPSIVTLTNILEMDIYDVCSNDGKYENSIMAMVFYAQKIEDQGAHCSSHVCYSVLLSLKL